MAPALFIVFRIINFGILLWLFAHVFRAYFYKDFKINARKRLDWWLALRNTIMQTRNKQKEIDTAIASEQWQAECLLENMACWRHYLHKITLEKQALFVRNEQKERERRAAQEENYHKRIEIQATIPAAFAQAQQKIATDYQAHNDKAILFINKTIKRIEFLP